MTQRKLITACCNCGFPYSAASIEGLRAAYADHVAYSQVKNAPPPQPHSLEPETQP